MTTDDTCRTCAQVTGTTRYCAPARCYCGHDACPAEWHPLPAVTDTTTTTKPGTSSWDTREESTWIDKL